MTRVDVETLRTMLAASDAGAVWADDSLIASMPALLDRLERHEAVETAVRKLRDWSLLTIDEWNERYGSWMRTSPFVLEEAVDAALAGLDVVRADDRG